MEEKLKNKIIDLLREDNPGLLLDESEQEAEKILYRKDIYEQAKFQLFGTL